MSLRRAFAVIASRLALLALPSALVVACADEASPDNGPEETGDLEIAGLWVDGFGAEHDITTETWAMAFPPMEGSGEPSISTFAFVSFSNEERWAIAQNGSANPFSADLFSRFDWTWVGQDLWFCQTSYDAATADAAQGTAAADATDPANAGCSGFSWSSLQPRVEP